MLRSKANNEQISVEQILAVSTQQKVEKGGIDARGTEVVDDSQLPEQKRRKASTAAVAGVEMRMLRLEHHMNTFMTNMTDSFARHGALLAGQSVAPTQ